MLKSLRSIDRYTRELLHTGSDSYKRPPYSSLGGGGGGGGGEGVAAIGVGSSNHHYNHNQGTTTAPYDWIYRGSGASIMPPLVRPHESSSAAATSYLMGSAAAAADECEVKTKLKCVLVGDGSVGKTSLVVSYTTNGYPTEYVPTAFDNYNVVVNVDSQPIRLQLCDTAGQDDFDSLRPLCYPQTDVFLVCFSVVSPTSFHNVREKWLPELRQHNPRPPIVLVGTQSDLRTDVKVLIELAQYREQPVSEVAARRLAHQIGAVGYVESSALTQRNLKEVFDQAILAALEARNLPVLTRGGSSKRSFSRYRKLGAMKDGNSGGLASSSNSSNGNNGATVGLVASGGNAGDGVTEPLNNSSRHHQQSPTSQNSHMLDYAEDTSRKRGWRKLCCFS